MTPERVKSLRERLGLSQGEFAKAVGTTHFTVTRWERPEESEPKGTAKYIMVALEEKLRKDPDQADCVIRFVLNCTRVGGLPYLLVRLFDLIPSDAT